MEVKFYSTDGRELLLGFGNTGLVATVKETGTPYHGGLTAKAEGQNLGNENPECNCNCMMQPYHVVRHGDSIRHLLGNYPLNEIAELIHLQDMLPPNQCPEQKARVFFEDAILFCKFHSQDSWVIDAASLPVSVYLN